MTKNSASTLKVEILRSKLLFLIVSIFMILGVVVSFGLFYLNYEMVLAAQPEKHAKVMNGEIKATYTPTPTPTPTFTPTPTATPTITNTPLPTFTYTPQPLPTNTLKPVPIGFDRQTNRPIGVDENEYWIDINLSEQILRLYYGSNLEAWFWVSTGKPSTPTNPGLFQIYVMYESALMYGADYYLPNVPYVMYYDDGYGIHGTYWNPPLGSTFSHGCTNMDTNDALYIFQRVHVGTTVYIHY